MSNFFVIFICIFSLISISVKADSLQIEQIGPTLKNPWGMDSVSYTHLTLPTTPYV